MSFAGPKKTENNDSNEPRSFQRSPKRSDQLCYQWICEKYIVNWYRNKHISAQFYNDVRDEIELLKKAKFDKKPKGPKKNQSNDLTHISDIDAVRQLSSDKPSQHQRPGEKQKKAFDQDDVEKSKNEQRLERELSQLQKQYERLKQSQNRQPQYTSAHERRQRNDTEVLNLRTENESLRAELQQAKDRISDLSKRIPQNRNANEQRLISELKTQTNDFQQAQEKIAKLNGQLADCRADFHDLEQNHSLMLRRLKKAEDNVQELTLRLSKMAGDNMRHGNPNLADLSDPYRPTEIGKIFAEIYDNEWSDAYEVVAGKEEKRKIQVLYDIMMGSYRFCYEALEKQTETVERCLLCPVLEDIEGVPGGQMPKLCQEEQFRRVLIDNRKRLALQTAKQLAEIYITTELTRAQDPSMTGKLSEKLKRYAGKCVELCWFMVICDPPLALSEQKVGDKFNSDIFRPYTRSQKDLKEPVIEMVVWPALYLHVGGALLSKGVAQPINAKELNK